MTQREKEKIILEKLIYSLSEFDSDHLEMMPEICLSDKEIGRWKSNRLKLNKVKEQFDDLLCVFSGKEPIFGSLIGVDSE